MFLNFVLTLWICAVIIVKMEVVMDLEHIIKSLTDIRTYCTNTSLDDLDAAIEILKKLQSDGVKDPLRTDFKNLVVQSK